MTGEKINSAGWRVLEEKVYEEFPIFRVRRSPRINPRTGSRYDFVLLDGLDWVNLIALTEKQEIVLVQQYRHGAEIQSLEIPGGCIEKGEEPATSALRELKEETGYVAKELVHLGTFYPNPAMMAMKCHSYFASGVKQESVQALDPGEDIEVVLRPIESIPQMILDGEISHSIVLTAFMLYYGTFHKFLPKSLSS